MTLVGNRRQFAHKSTNLPGYSLTRVHDLPSLLSAVMIAADLIAPLRLLAPGGSLAKPEPKSLRCRILHVRARLIRAARVRLFPGAPN
jgi:hypothetical protein